MCPYLCTDKIAVFVAVHLPVLLEHTVLGTSAHEVEVTLAGGNKAAHSGSRLPTTITALKNEGRNNHHLKLYQNAFHMPAQTSSYLKKIAFISCLYLTRWRPLETALCTCRRALFSSYTSADQRQQLTWAHSFCPMYNSRPAS